jgi:hypothetical protein
VILVDTNAIVDVLSDDPHWAARSSSALQTAASRDKLAINEIVYAELAAGFTGTVELESAIDRLQLRFVRLPKEALFVAGHAFRRYRHSGGPRANVLSDFFIGAHAAVTGAPLLTRDTRRIKTYFPRVSLIEP